VSDGESALPGRRLPVGLRAFAHRDFRLFWIGQQVSLIGTWMQSVAQSWLVLELTGSPFKLGVVSSLQFAPMLFLSFFAGALADRRPKRKLLFISQSVLLGQSLLLALLVWHGHVQYWHVAVMALLYGIANTVDMPARQSFIVEMVGKEDLLSAIAINSAMFNAARVVGPALAGLLIAHLGIAHAFFLNALSFVPVLAALFAMDAQGLPHPRQARPMREEIREGLAYAARTPRIAIVLSLVLGVSAFLFNYNVVVPVLAREVLHVEARGFGILMTMLGAGAVCGAAALTAVGRGRPPLWALVTPAVLLGVCTMLLSTVHAFWAASALMLVMGLCGILFMAGANTTLQLTVPDHLRGRIMSLHTFVFAGVTPFGAFLVGSITEALGIRAGLLASGAAGILSVLVVLGWRAWRRSLA
jgi:MFS family permease